MPDLIVTFHLAESIGLVRRIIVGISGRSGRWLWSYPVDEKAIKLSRTRIDPPAVLVKTRHSAVVAYVDGTQWVGLDPATGKRVAGPFDLGCIPVTPAQYADSNADGEPEVLVLGPDPTGTQAPLSAFSIKTGGAALERTSRFRLSGSGHRQFLARPSHDRRSRRRRPAGNRDRRRRQDAAAGRLSRRAPDRWFHRSATVAHAMRPARAKANDGLVEIIVAPDLDGDSVAEVITVSVHHEGDPWAVYVDALSGKDGRRLWWWKSDLPLWFPAIGKPRWWGRGADGWPMLALPWGADDDSIEGRLHRLAAGARRNRSCTCSRRQPGASCIR